MEIPLVCIYISKGEIMKFGKRKFRYKGGGQVNETRAMTISFIVGILIIMLLIYFV